MIVQRGVITRQSSDSIAKDQVVAAASRYIREHALEVPGRWGIWHLRISRAALEEPFRRLGRSPKGGNPAHPGEPHSAAAAGGDSFTLGTDHLE